MLYRILLVVLPVALGAAIYSGAMPGHRLVSGSSYSKEVPATPADVRAALGAMPLGPGSEGDGPPLVRTENSDGFTWSATSGDKVVMTMKATIVPLDNGRASRVDADVSPGDAPVPPRFPTASQVSRVFAKLLDATLNPLLLESERMPAQIVERNREDGRGYLNALQIILNPEAVRARFQQVARQAAADAMTRYRAQPVTPTLNYQPDGVSRPADPMPGETKFEPGKPMVDVRR